MNSLWTWIVGVVGLAEFVLTVILLPVKDPQSYSLGWVLGAATGAIACVIVWFRSRNPAAIASETKAERISRLTADVHKLELEEANAATQAETHRQKADRFTAAGIHDEAVASMSEATRWAKLHENALTDLDEKRSELAATKAAESHPASASSGSSPNVREANVIATTDVQPVRRRRPALRTAAILAIISGAGMIVGLSLSVADRSLSVAIGSPALFLLFVAAAIALVAFIAQWFRWMKRQRASRR